MQKLQIPFANQLQKASKRIATSGT
jgi:hypothetical protein